jgi:AcrR family transcriptional regulator
MPRDKASRTGRPSARNGAGQARRASRGKRERNKAQNRTEILAAAREVFTELGYDAATVRDIIRKTRLASGTFYNYFPDKESVFRALLRDSEERRLERLSRVVADPSRGYEAYVRDAVRAYFDFVVSDRTTFDLLRRNAESIRAFSNDPVFNEQARIRAVLEHEIAAGAIPPVDAEFLAQAIVGVTFEIAVIMVERDPVDIDAATAFVSDLFSGFFARASRTPERPLAGEPRRRVPARA